MKNIESLLEKIKITKSCWIWTGVIHSEGYGQYKQKLAHRVVYELFKKEIPKGLELDHLCRNRICVNPNHLEPVTRKENILRGSGITAFNAHKTHCIHGHLLSGKNLQIYIEKSVYSKTGKITTGKTRRCKTCIKLRYLKKAPTS